MLWKAYQTDLTPTTKQTRKDEPDERSQANRLPGILLDRASRITFNFLETVGFEIGRHLFKACRNRLRLSNRLALASVNLFTQALGCLSQLLCSIPLHRVGLFAHFTVGLLKRCRGVRGSLLQTFRRLIDNFLCPLADVINRVYDTFRNLCSLVCGTVNDTVGLIRGSVGCARHLIRRLVYRVMGSICRTLDALISCG